MNKVDSMYVLTWAKKIKAINLLGGKCECCGEDNIFVLCFHHKDPNEKKFEIGDGIKSRWSVLKHEILKCKLVCNNCHMELHDSIENKNTRRIKNKKIFLEFKNKFECVECGYDKSNRALNFHHRDKEIKDFTFGKLSGRFKTVYDLTKEIEEELNKCNVICTNCHNREHVDIEKFKKFRTEIYKKVSNYKEKQKPLDKDLVLKMYNNGKKQVEIVKHFGCAKSTVSMIIKSLK